MSTPPAEGAPRKILTEQQKQAVYAEIKEMLRRKQVQEEYVKRLNENLVENIKQRVAHLIDTAGKHWCGNWTRRNCHYGGRLGEKCSNVRHCDDYMVTAYDSDPNGKAKYDEWFANTDYYVVDVFEDVFTKELIYNPRERSGE
jgi:hypothetical protein